MALKNFFISLKNWWNSVTNDAAEALKDPLRDHKLAINAGEQKLEGFRTRLAQLMASSTGLNRKLVQLQAESLKYDKIAAMAAAANNVDDVRDAVKLKQKVDAEIGELNRQFALNGLQVERLRGVLDVGQHKIEQAKLDLTALAARLEGAHLREDMAKAESDFMGGGGMSSLEDLRKLVEQHEDQADAQTTLSVSPEAAVEKRLEDAYETPSTIDADVQKYMTAAGDPPPVTKKKAAA